MISTCQSITSFQTSAPLGNNTATINTPSPLDVLLDDTALVVLEYVDELNTNALQAANETVQKNYSAKLLSLLKSNKDLFMSDTFIRFEEGKNNLKAIIDLFDGRLKEIHKAVQFTALDYHDINVDADIDVDDVNSTAEEIANKLALVKDAQKTSSIHVKIHALRTTIVYLDQLKKEYGFKNHTDEECKKINNYYNSFLR